MMGYDSVIGISTIVVVYVFGTFVGLGEPAPAVLAFAAGPFTFALWRYSPLPNHNAGLMSGDPGRYWGFRDDG